MPINEKEYYNGNLFDQSTLIERRSYQQPPLTNVTAP